MVETSKPHWNWSEAEFLVTFPVKTMHRLDTKTHGYNTRQPRSIFCYCSPLLWPDLKSNLHTCHYARRCEYGLICVYTLACCLPCKSRGDEQLEKPILTGLTLMALMDEVDYGKTFRTLDYLGCTFEILKNFLLVSFSGCINPMVWISWGKTFFFNISVLNAQGC